MSKVTVKLSAEYSEKELAFLKEHNCEILSKIKLPNGFDFEIPKRMFVYYGSYIGEIEDEDGLVWSVLSKFKGKYHWGECYEDMKTLEDGF